MGYSGKQTPIKSNWATVSRILDQVRIHGKDTIQPEEFQSLKPRDGLFIKQIGQHCFAILYYHDIKTVLVTDGLNSYYEDEFARQVIETEFKGCKIEVIPFHGQNQDNRCASATAAALIEFQRVYRTKLIPIELIPAKSTYARIQAVLHKIDTNKITGPVMINEQLKGVTCQLCGRNFRHAKNRNVLNFHKCKE